MSAFLVIDFTTLLTLVSIPAVYALLDDAQAALGRLLGRRPAIVVGTGAAGYAAGTFSPVVVEAEVPIPESGTRRKNSDLGSELET